MDFASSKIPVNIEDEMKRSYMDYAMSVIIGRALPDVRDGLKPAHRRVLYGMRLMGLASNRGYRKCAKIVGEVMGNFHPHGDASIYDTLVRLSQDFNMRYPLVDGQGNFGSVDGDPPAAMRYTEARLQAFAEELMSDLDKETVDFVPNYDETTEEPTVLPAPIPNLLVNGSSGIAVGMATNIPPHNLREVIDGIIYVIGEQQKVSRRVAQGLPASNISDEGDRTTTRDERLRQLLRIVTGPDFPTGGYIVGRQGIVDAFRTGRGSVLLRARHEFEQSKKGDKTSIVVSEIPYQVNKARLIEKIADLVRDKVIEGISDLRDESDRDGMRIVIEVKRGEMPEVVLNNLYKHTALQTSFGIIMLAIVGGRPRVLNLLEFIEQFIEFRREVVRRRIEFELRKAEARAHILEGLRIALDHLDAVISLIRGSKSTPEARDGLMREFGLSQLQAQAILEMQLQRLTGLERQKILDELADLLKTIEHLRGILASDERLMQLIIDELLAVQEKYSDDRRTEILEAEGELRIEDLDRRGRRRDHRERHGLHQAHGDHDLPQPAARGPRPHRDEDQGRGLRRASLRRVHARLPHDLLGSRPGLLAEGPRDPGSGRGGQGEGDCEPRVDAAARAHRGRPDGPRLGGRQVRGDGHAPRGNQENGAPRVQQPPHRRNHRDGHRGGLMRSSRRPSATAPGTC